MLILVGLIAGWLAGKIMQGTGFGVTAGLTGTQRTELLALADRRFRSELSPDIASQYLIAAFNCNPSAATQSLIARLGSIEQSARKNLVEHFLPAIFGGPFVEEAQRAPIPFEALVWLVEVAFNVIRIEDDVNRPSLKVYSPELRDNAQHARGRALQTLSELPGQATFDALTRFSELAGFPIDPVYIRDLARNRALQDSEGSAWSAADVVAYERDGEAPPVSGFDLQNLAMRRISDIQCVLIDGDFNQGRTFKILPDETAVQNWTAERLRLMQGRSYSVEREVHVAEEKEPDVRIRAKASDTSVAVEIKIAEKWDLIDLEQALDAQLCGQYLRAPTARHGILLLVHRKRRPKGWKTGKGTYLSFDEMVTHLERKAARIAKASWNAPQPLIGVLDVSTIDPDRKAKKSKRAKRKAKKQSVGKIAPRQPTSAKTEKITPNVPSKATTQKKAKRPAPKSRQKRKR